MEFVFRRIRFLLSVSLSLTHSFARPLVCCFCSQINGCTWCDAMVHQLTLHYTLSVRRLSAFNHLQHSKCMQRCHIECVFVCCRCAGLFLSFNFHLSRPDIPTNVQIRTMDICTGWPTVTDLSSLFGVASRRALCECVCTPQSHSLLLFFAVDGGSCKHFCFISFFSLPLSLFSALLVAFNAHRSPLKTFNCILPWK